MFNRIIVAAGYLATSLLISQQIWAAESTNHSAELAPFVSEDTFAVAYVDIAALDLPKDQAEIFNPQTLLVLSQLPAEAQSQIFGLVMVQGFAMRFRDAGGQSLYVLAGLGDAHLGGGPVLLATARVGQRPEKVEQMFKDVIREIVDDPSQKMARPILQQFAIRRKGDIVLVGMKGTVDRYSDLKSTARHNLVDPLTRLSAEGAVAAVVFCPGADFRRVVRELWPELPGPLAPLRGELADRWLHVEAAVNAPPNAKPRIALQTSDPDAASTFVRLWESLPDATTQFGGNDKSVDQAKRWAQLLVNALPAKAEGNHVTISLPTDEERTAKIRETIGAAMNAASEVSYRKERTDRFKQIALAMLNYESANKRLPAAAIRDKEGRPLLSWRVAILPYLEQSELYKQFHLDEPWDSPHNSSLIAKMPGAYMDLGPGADKKNREGKTICQVPIGPETAFHSNEGAKYRDIVDGTVNTVLLVEVEPAQAVVWTKPDDLEVDLEHPRRGFERTDRDQFLVAWCDGSVQYIANNIEEKKLRAYLTRAGREVVDRP